MNKNEIGRPIAVNVGEDISGADDYQIILALNKYSLTVGVADGVTIGAVDLVFTPDGETVEVTYLADQYLLYTTKAGDVPYAGRWSGRSHIEFIAPSIANFYGDLDYFVVGE